MTRLTDEQLDEIIADETGAITKLEKILAQELQALRQAKPIIVEPNEQDINDFISSHVPMPWPFEVSPQEYAEILEVRNVVGAAIAWAVEQTKVAYPEQFKDILDAIEKETKE